MAWFENKAKKRSRAIVKTLEGADPTAAAILDGDENATTPVEGPTLAKLARLQPFSPVAISLLRLLDRDDADIKKIVDLVRSDPALAAETLAYVNSPLFAVRQAVVDLQHAIAVLGCENTRGLVTTLAMRAMLKNAPRPAVVRRIWQHSIATAVIASELAPLFEVDPALADTAGVLHDVGRIGLLAQYGENYTRLVLSICDNVEAVLQAERDICALDHCDVGLYLGQVWKLPDMFQEVAARHHNVQPEVSLLGLIHAACAMADDLTFSAVAHHHILSIDDRVAECVPLKLREGVKAKWNGMEDRIRKKVDLLEF